MYTVNYTYECLKEVTTIDVFPLSKLNSFATERLNFKHNFT